MTEDHWEHRSFKEQGLDLIPQTHLGEKASAMERAGIRTIRRDINRDIIARNSIINAARAAYEKAREELVTVKAIPVAVVKAFTSEIIDMIRKMAERNNNRLSLPIVKGKYIGSVSDRASLQDKDKMGAYVRTKGWATFEEMKSERKTVQSKYDQLDKDKTATDNRIDYLDSLLEAYAKYEPYEQIYQEYWKLKKAEENNKGKNGFLGFAKKSVAQEYKQEHQTELNTRRMYRNALKDMIEESDKLIRPKAWQKERDTLAEKLPGFHKSISAATVDLAKMEVLKHNRRDLERMLENESHDRGREHVRDWDPSL